MSFNTSSSAHNQNRQFSTLWLTGGYDPDDCNPKKLRIDLRVSGGALIKRNLAVLGNITAKGTIQSNMAGNLITNAICAANTFRNILVKGNLETATFRRIQ